LGDWAEGNEMKINPNKSKALSFTTARVKDPLNYSYSLGDQKIPEAGRCKYLRIIIRNDLSWADQVNYTVQNSLEGTTIGNAYCKKGNLKYEKFSLYVPFSNMGRRAGILTGNVR
jgi:hypothetical protein